MAEVWELSATEMVEAVRSGETSRQELVRAHGERAETINPAVHAIVEPTHERALHTAEAADRERGRETLPLDGVPITVKGHLDYEGTTVSQGVPGTEHVSPASTPAVRRLVEAGALVVGKTNLPDLTIRWNTVSSLHGTTRNPRDLDASAGGSSGGDAAAVASGVSAVGVGSDYGGSIRVPASFCGVLGMRGTTRLVPDTPMLPPFDTPPTADFMNSIGPIARTVEDLALVHATMRGPDLDDPGCLARPDLPADEGPVTVACMSDHTGAVLEPAVRTELRRTAALLEECGFTVVEAGIPRARRAAELWCGLVGTELLHVTMPRWRDRIGDSNRQHIEEMFGLYDLGDRVSPYVDAWVERRAVVRETAAFMEEHPIVLTPIAGMPTPRLDFDHYLSREATQDLFDHMRSIGWVNLLGLPSVALPNGVQLVARRFHDDQALSVAAAVLERLGPVGVAQPA
ncbi:MAG: amidase [Streptosporangiaceae bacterium]